MLKPGSGPITVESRVDETITRLLESLNAAAEAEQFAQRTTNSSRSKEDESRGRGRSIMLVCEHGFGSRWS